MIIFVEKKNSVKFDRLSTLGVLLGLAESSQPYMIGVKPERDSLTGD